MTDSDSIPGPVADCPPSAKAVYLVLDRHGPLTRRELAAHLEVEMGELRYPFKKLTECGVLAEHPDTRDGRRNQYDIK